MSLSDKCIKLIPPGDFPFNELPPPWRKLFRYLDATSHSSIGLIGPSILSLAATVVQGSCNVKVNSHIQHPTTIYAIHAAPTGSGKTFNLNRLCLAIDEKDNQSQQDYIEQQQEYDQDKRVWDVKMKCAERAFSKALKEEIDGQQHEEIIRQLQEEMPIPPIYKKLILNDLTPAAMKQELGNGNLSFSIISDEGGLLFKTLLHETTDLNKLWSGSSIAMRRVNRSDINVIDARVGIFVMIQPKALQKYLSSQQGETVKDNGFLYRCLISKSEPTHGKKMLTDTSHLNHDDLKWFHKRLTELLSHNIERRRRGEGFHTIELSDESLSLWNEMHTVYMDNTGPGRALEKYQDYVPRFLENWTRIAAVIEVFTNGHVAQVSLESMRAGFEIANWYLDHFVAIMSAEDGTDSASISEVLDTWLKANIYWKGYVEIDKNYIRQFGPPCIRSKDRLDAALAVLASEGKVKVYKSSQTLKVKYIEAEALHNHRDYINHGNVHGHAYFGPNGLVVPFDKDDLDKVPTYRVWSK